MRSALFLLFISFLGMVSCHHSDNTPAPVIDPLIYVDSMAGNHHWQGMGYSYVGPPNGSAPFDSLTISSDEILGVNSSNKKISFLDDSLHYLGSNTVANTLTFTASDLTSYPNYTVDTLVYNYSSKTYLFKRYELHQNHGILTVLQSP